MCVYTSALNGVGINTKEPPKIGGPGIPHSCDGRLWLTARYTLLPHMCYQVKFDSSATKGVRINRREPPKSENAGILPHWGGALLTPKTSLLPMCFHVNNKKLS